MGANSMRPVKTIAPTTLVYACACRKMCTAVERAFDAAWKAAGLERSPPASAATGGGGGAGGSGSGARNRAASELRPCGSAAEQSDASGSPASSAEWTPAGARGGGRGGDSVSGGGGGMGSGRGGGISGRTGGGGRAKRRADALGPTGSAEAATGRDVRRCRDGSEEVCTGAGSGSAGAAAGPAQHGYPAASPADRAPPCTGLKSAADGADLRHRPPPQDWAAAADHRRADHLAAMQRVAQEWKVLQRRRTQAAEAAAAAQVAQTSCCASVLFDRGRRPRKK